MKRLIFLVYRGEAMASCGATSSMVLVATVFILLLGLFAQADNEGGIRISKLERRVDLTSHVVRISTYLKVENVGAEPTSQVLFALSKDQAEKASFITAAVREGKGKNKVLSGPLVVDSATKDVSQPDAELYGIALAKPLSKGEFVELEVQVTLAHALKPFPAEIKQSEMQLVLYYDSAWALSPYPVRLQTAIFKLPSSHIESYTKVEPNKAVGLEIKYGPYENIQPFSSRPVKIHFENNHPFSVLKVLEREIEISHWGNIYVTETCHLVHGGAHHKGGFSRLDFQSKPTASGVAALRHLLALLPPRAHSVYYRDEIGNISTSHLRSDYKKTEVLLEPRYPLFGGWQVMFTLGYSVPLRDFVFRSSDGRRYLNFSFGSPFHDVVVEKLVVKVVLPEGSRNPEPSVPFSVDMHQEIKYSYLDTVGRTVVVLTKENVVPEHNVPFLVHYKFSPLAMLAEPLMLIIGIFSFFLASIAYIHFDFPISKSSLSYQARIQREEMLDAVQRIQKVIKARLLISEKLEASLRDLARTGDVAACKAIRKSSETALKDSAKEVKFIYDSLQATIRSSSVFAKVEALIQKEKEKQDKLLQKHNMAVELYERKVSSKDIDARLAPYEQKYALLKQEVAECLDAVDDC